MVQPLVTVHTVRVATVTTATMDMVDTIIQDLLAKQAHTQPHWDPVDMFIIGQLTTWAWAIRTTTIPDYLLAHTTVPITPVPPIQTTTITMATTATDTMATLATTDTTATVATAATMMASTLPTNTIIITTTATTTAATPTAFTQATESLDYLTANNTTLRDITK